MCLTDGYPPGCQLTFSLGRCIDESKVGPIEDFQEIAVEGGPLAPT